MQRIGNQPSAGKTKTPAGTIRSRLASCNAPQQTATEPFVCSGADREGKPTYALFDERVPPAPERTREEALAELAARYFRSHSPARLEDFAW